MFKRLRGDTGKGAGWFVAILGLAAIAVLGMYAHKNGLGSLLPPAKGK